MNALPDSAHGAEAAADAVFAAWRELHPIERMIFYVKQQAHVADSAVSVSQPDLDLLLLLTASCIEEANG